MKRFLVVFALLFLLDMPVASADTPGVMRGKLPEITESKHSTYCKQPGRMTDGNLSTYNVGTRDCKWYYVFDDPVDLYAYKYSAEFGYNIKTGLVATFYDDDDSVLGQFTYARADVDWTNFDKPFLGVKRLILTYTSPNVGYIREIDFLTTRAPNPPASAQITTIEPTHDRITLHYTAVDATHFDIYVDGQLVDTVNERSYVITGLSADTTYSVWIVAWNEFGSRASQRITVTTKEQPPVPSILDFGVSELLDRTVRVSFNVLRADTIDFYLDGELVGTIPGNRKDYALMLEPATVYQVWFVAHNPNGSVTSRVLNFRTEGERIPQKVQLGVDLRDVADATTAHFHFLWPIIAFCAGVVCALVVSVKIRAMFYE